MRSGGGLTSSQTADAQAGYESLMTMLPTFLAGINWVMHSAGWLEGGLVASYEKFVLDCQVLEMLQQEFTPLEIDEASLAFGAHDEVRHGGHFLGAAHTMERFRTCFYRPFVNSSDNYDRWMRNGAKDAAARARDVARKKLDEYEPPPLDDAVREELAGVRDPPPPRAGRLRRNMPSAESVPATARVVVIGAGIVGNSLVHHLAQLGWRDIVQIDKGPLPNPGGSTGHASNFIFPVDHSRELADLTLDSVRQYKELGVFTESGRLRGRPHRGADGGAAPPDVVGPGVGRTGRAGDAGPRRRARPVPGQGQDPRRVLVPVGRRGRLAARGHADARVRAGARRAHRACRPSRWSAWTSSRAGSGGCAPPAATSRPRPS